MAILFSGILLGLVFGTDGEAGLISLLIFFAIVCYAILELFVKAKNYYNAGIDNILMVSILVFILSVLFIEDFNNQYLVAAAIATIVSLWLCVRFTDACMAMLAYTALFLLIFLLYIKAGDIAKATAPFVMMIVSAIVYFLMNKLHKTERLLFYKSSFQSVMLLTLITFYACGNYFVVKELSNEMFGLNLGLDDPIPYGWVFWIFTIVIPPAYIFYGIKKKELLFIRTGLLLVVITIFTVRYYYAILDAEIAMMIAGLILIVITYVLVKYLKTPRHGFTFENTGFVSRELLNAEALIIAQTFGEKKSAEHHFEFGGGSSGGGGATGGF